MFTKWFNQKAEIDILSRLNTSLSADLETERYRVKELEKQVTAERKKVDKYVLELSNVCGRVITGKQGTLFTEVKDEPKVQAIDTTINDETYDDYKDIAKVFRDKDIERGMANVQPLEAYIKIVAENPKQYIY